MRKIFVIVLVLGMGYALFAAALWRLTDGFRLAHIQSDAAFSLRWEITGQDEAMAKDLLAQKFYYIGKGSQCYVFESTDHDVVLKLFRYPRYRLHPIARYITAPAFVAEIQNARAAVKQQKLDDLFTSCMLAYQELHEETGLVYLHLNKTDHLKQTVVLHDKLRRAYPIAIDDYEFVIQKKGEQIFPYLTRLLIQNKKQEARQALGDLAALLHRRVQKGIEDYDAVIHKNSGFRGQKALFLDVGGFARSAPPNAQEILWRTTKKLRAWLNAQDLQLAEYFEQALRNDGIPLSNVYFSLESGKSAQGFSHESPLLIKSIQNM